MTGEGGTIGAPAAIANALADAPTQFGAEIFELPMTPERLFRRVESFTRARRRRELGAVPPQSSANQGHTLMASSSLPAC